MSHPTLGRLSRRPDNDPQLMKKVKFFACAVSVFVCDGEGGWDKSAKYLHRYRQSKTANFKILTWTVLYRFSGVLGKKLDMSLIKVAGAEVTGTPRFSSSCAPRGRRNPQAEVIRRYVTGTTGETGG